jgi:hypothetical protein
MANLSPLKLPVMQGINREFSPKSALLAISTSGKPLQSLRFFPRFPTQRNREFLWQIRELESLNRELRRRMRQLLAGVTPPPSAVVELDVNVAPYSGQSFR